MIKNKAIKFCLFLLVAVTIGVSPALAQDSSGIKTLDLELASDDELIQALDKASDIELVNKEDNLSVSPANASGNEPLDESRRLLKLAEDAFSEADYDKSAMLADDAAYLATQSAAKALEEKSASVGSSLSLPATYTVRPWAVSKDCFWNIAGFPWVYGDPHQWRLLYNANKTKLPNPNNPNILEPGTVLDIPSIKGELRQGAWESGKTYGVLNK